jgi:hypothetical protein
MPDRDFSTETNLVSPTDAALMPLLVGGADGVYTGSLLKGYLGMYSGAGSPEGSVTGTLGDIYEDETNGNLYQKRSGTATNTGWQMISYPRVNNQNTAGQTLGTNATTYINGSALVVPLTGLKQGTRMYWQLTVTKTGAGTAANSIDVRVGTAASTADTSRASLSMGAGTGVIDTAVIEVWAHLLTVGSGTSAVLVGALKAGHNLQNTGFFVLPVVAASATSAGFDSTPANLKIGLSWTSGASMVPTVVICQATMENL